MTTEDNNSTIVYHFSKEAYQSGERIPLKEIVIDSHNQKNYGTMYPFVVENTSQNVLESVKLFTTLPDETYKISQSNSTIPAKGKINAVLTLYGTKILETANKERLDPPKLCITYKEMVNWSN